MSAASTGRRSEARARITAPAPTCDFEMDKADFEAGRQIACPLLVIWGAKSHTGRVHGDVLAVWRDYAADVDGGPIDAAITCRRKRPRILCAGCCGTSKPRFSRLRLPAGRGLVGLWISFDAGRGDWGGERYAVARLRKQRRQGRDGRPFLSSVGAPNVFRCFLQASEPGLVDRGVVWHVRSRTTLAICLADTL